MKVDEIGPASSTHRFGNKCVENFAWEGFHLEDLGVDGKRKTKMCLGDIGLEVVDWIYLAQNMNRW
jgi:hypothetical protein